VKNSDNHFILSDGSEKKAGSGLFAAVDLKMGEKGLLFKGEILTKNSYNSKVQTEQILPGYKYKYCYIKSLILFITIINRLRSFYAKRKGLFMF
jgi:hypothetical protein